MEDIDDLFNTLKCEGAEELRNAIEILIQEAIDTRWPVDSEESKIETRWFIEGLKYALLIVNYTPIKAEADTWGNDNGRGGERHG